MRRIAEARIGSSVVSREGHALLARFDRIVVAFVAAAKTTPAPVELWKKWGQRVVSTYVSQDGSFGYALQAGNPHLTVAAYVCQHAVVLAPASWAEAGGHARRVALAESTLGVPCGPRILRVDLLMLQP
ncbi:hypothetical protein AK812_SmicGene7359 [Symbiodinium microadriaticum]|uniref:Uncharacterized protein n=1 Tax=Symbiodinium microadriaticum TaxID=2951 RepID=A0A1Q9ENN1_SYMMI|nr:hypothetical protein AK812_SmicGene7359 [Symbiodinium microadriaticum]